MAFNSTHWSIDYSAKTITNTDSGTGARLPSVTGDQSGVGTVLAWFQWLATTFAASAQMDDSYPVVSDTPTVYRFINGWAFGHADDYKYLSGGGIESADGDDLCSQVAGTQLYIIQNGSELPVFWDTDNIDILVKVKSGGTLIDGGNVLVMAREYGDFFDHNTVALGAGGRNPVGINTAVDGNNDTSIGTVAAYSMSVTFGAISRDMNNGEGSKPYDCEVDCGGLSMKAAYEYLKWRSMHNATGGSLNGDDAEEYLSANEPTYAEIKVAPFGTLAGTTLYGARGIWFTNYSVADFVLMDANGDTQSPPNYQKVNCSHTSLSGCNVFVAEISGGNVIKDQYTISSVTSNSITMTANINANKAPQSGTVKIGDTKYAYTSFSGAVLSGVTPNPTGETGDAYIPLLDVTATSTSELSDNIIYSADIDVITSVRKYGFKPYDVESAFTNVGLSFTPILATDPQAT